MNRNKYLQSVRPIITLNTTCLKETGVVYTLKEAQELEETQVDFSWNDYFEVVPLVEGADDYISDDWEPV